MEKSGRQYLNQVIKVITTTMGHVHITFLLKGDMWFLWYYCQKCMIWIWSWGTSDTPKLRIILPSNWLVLFKSVKVRTFLAFRWLRLHASAIGVWSLVGKLRASLVAQIGKCLPIMQKTRVWSLGWEDPLEKEMATHSSVLAWKIP